MTFKETLTKIIYDLLKEEPFLGALLQEFYFKIGKTQVPTAALVYNKQNKHYNVTINEDFFFNKLENIGQRKAVLLHELMHFLHGHITRFPENGKENRMLWNVAADMAINQFIKDLPKECVNVDNFKSKDGTPFPKYRSMEEYLELLRPLEEEVQKKYGKGENSIDEHNWEDTSGMTEKEKEEMLKETRDLLQRTFEKTRYGHDNMPDYIKDLMQTLDDQISKLNYKAILQMAMKKTLVHNNRVRSWTRPSRRYGSFAPGTKAGNVPNLTIYMDTSGSIALEEFNQFLGVLNGLLQAGSRKCTIKLWHTNVYHTFKHRLGKPITMEDFQAGGTTVTCVLDDIQKVKPDLSIILTDGFFERSDVTSFDTEVVWVISKDGDVNHPNKAIGKTVPLGSIL